MTPGKEQRRRLPDVYDAACDILERHCTGARNIALERHPFRERHELLGESIPDCTFALREWAASCDFAVQANDNMCDHFVTGVRFAQLWSRLLLQGDTLKFDHAVEIALLSKPAQQQSKAFFLIPLSASHANIHVSMTLPNEAPTIVAGTATRHASFMRAALACRMLTKRARHLKIQTLRVFSTAKICRLVIIAPQVTMNRWHAPLAAEPASHSAIVTPSYECVVAHAEHEDKAPLTSKK